MLDKLKQAFTDSDWPAIDPILLPLDLHEAEALLSHVLVARPRGIARPACRPRCACR